MKRFFDWILGRDSHECDFEFLMMWYTEEGDLRVDACTVCEQWMVSSA